MQLLSKLKPALTLQLSHLALNSVWNIAGVSLVQQGLPALGPTASMATVALLVAFAALLLLGANKYAKLYVVVSLIVLAGALSAILPAFYKDPSLWPSDFWRYSGVLLNSAGVIGAIWGMLIWRRNK